MSAAVLAAPPDTAAADHLLRSAAAADTADDSLSCQWEKCSERCTSAEALFVRGLYPLLFTVIHLHNLALYISHHKS
jgi:hypothetical protein